MRSLVIKMTDIAACPLTSLSPQHYRETGGRGGRIECACGLTCEWFANCDHPATGFMAHPIITDDVPICDRCRLMIEAMR